VIAVAAPLLKLAVELARIRRGYGDKDVEGGLGGDWRRRRGATWA
jgi:hypothetical protein